MAHKDKLSIKVGRDLIIEVLRPHLGPDTALERANNIAQALVLGAGSPTDVALDMLRHTHVDDKLKIAVEVGRAWMSGTMAKAS